MTSVTFSGLVGFAWLVGVVLIAAVPVWLAANAIGAGNPSLLRAATSLIVGVIGSVVGLIFAGPFIFLIVPFVFLLSFKYILDTSFVGALVLAILALIAYFLMAKFIGGGVSIDKKEKEPDNQVAMFYKTNRTIDHHKIHQNPRRI